MTVTNPSPGPQYDFGALTAGESVLPRLATTQGVGGTSGTMRLTYWTATKTEPITKVVTSTNNQAAGATPTLCRIGVYSEAANGDLTLLAAIANDTTLFATTFTDYQRTLTSTFNKVAGQRYAVALLVVTAAVHPNVFGFNGLGSEQFRSPKLSAQVTGQTDLPASIANGLITSNGALFQMIWLP